MVNAYIIDSAFAPRIRISAGGRPAPSISSATVGDTNGNGWIAAIIMGGIAG
jgi:hypothetical protein